MCCNKNILCRQRALTQIINKQSDFLELARRVRTEQLVVAAAQLCHMDDQLAHHTWLRLFPRLWTTLDERQLGVCIHRQNVDKVTVLHHVKPNSRYNHC